jgi:predicted O-methyltransferase YrrM
MINRIKLAEYFNELGFKVGAEIGVAYGYYSEVLCQSIPGLKLYCVDSWKGYVGYDTRYEKYEEMFEQAKKVLSKYNCEFIRKYSMDAVKDFEDGSLDFVYIDANHDYDHTLEDIREWTKKVKIGGIVSGHDYYMSKRGNVKVKEAVNTYIAETGYELQLTDWRRHLEKKDNQQPSWYFIKNK